jgi:predicted PurR-regulated permease PerM
LHTGAPPAVAHGVHRHASVLRLLACVALGWILLPFYGAILWAVVIGLVFFPVFNWLLSRMRGRRTLAAVVTLALVVLAGMLPVALTIAMLALELMNLVNALASGQIDLAAHFNSLHHALPGWLASMVDRIGLTSLSALQRRLAETLAQGGERMVRSAFNVGQDTFGLLAGVFITLYLSFFLVRDGEAIATAVGLNVPIAPDQRQALLERFTSVVLATIRGSFLVAMVQGALGGLAFWFLGVTSALLWAVLMAFLSLLPAVGAALVWAPMAVWLLATGDVWQGLALMAWGLLVISLADNLLRPMLVGQRAGMPDFMVMITTLGGLATLGLNGLVLGPVVGAMFMAIWHIYGVPPHSPTA